MAKQRGEGDVERALMDLAVSYAAGVARCAPGTPEATAAVELYVERLGQPFTPTPGAPDRWRIRVSLERAMSHVAVRVGLGVVDRPEHLAAWTRAELKKVAKDLAAGRIRRGLKEDERCRS